mgnify:FL=1
MYHIRLQGLCCNTNARVQFNSSASLEAKPKYINSLKRGHGFRVIMSNTIKLIPKCVSCFNNLMNTSYLTFDIQTTLVNLKANSTHAIVTQICNVYAPQWINLFSEIRN